MRAATALSNSRFLLFALLTLGLVSAFSMPAYASCVMGKSGIVSLLSFFVTATTIVGCVVISLRSKDVRVRRLYAAAAWGLFLISLASSFFPGENLFMEFYPKEYADQFGGYGVGFDYHILQQKLKADGIAILALVLLVYAYRYKIAARRHTFVFVLFLLAGLLFGHSSYFALKAYHHNINKRCCYTGSLAMSECPDTIYNYKFCRDCVGRLKALDKTLGPQVE